MKTKILATRRQVVRAIIEAFPGGREMAAAWLGLELKKFDNHAYESSGSRPLTDDQLLALEQHAGTSFYADFVSRQYGGVFVLMPPDTELDNLDLYARSLATDVAEGKVNQIIAHALRDGRIGEAELAEIIAAHRKHIAARHAEIGAVITLHRQQGDKA
ncbi:YmfL family putative regulatory protein [Pseudomonas sp. C9-3]|uniref:YmfL family putative regulatory protein n=1 Tax=Pseudomonas sp. C9-3 TaxID=3078264 RepID=UPI0028F13A60|nr:YmfL family putative regulatory protein [Pseudomonas sp. C9-3]